AERYRVPAGYSDHTLGIAVATAAAALGATVIEKHLTLDRQMKGTDHACSVEPQDLFEMVANIRRIETALGRADKPPTGAQAATKRKLGRSLVTRRPLPAGTLLEESMLMLKSPGEGVSWTERSKLFGRRLLHDVAGDEPVLLSDVA